MPFNTAIVKFNELVMRVAESLEDVDDFDLDSNNKESMEEFEKLTTMLEHDQQELIHHVINHAIDLMVIK